MSKIKLNNQRKKKPINYSSDSNSDINSGSEIDSEMVYDDDSDDTNKQTDILKILDKKYIKNKNSEKKRNKSGDNETHKPSSLFKDDNSNEEKIEIIDKILKMFPEMKNQRNIILSEILTPKPVIDDRYILEKIIINGNTYYKDKYRNILDPNVNLVGMWDFDTGDFRYHIFAEEVYNVNANNEIINMKL